MTGPVPNQRQSLSQRLRALRRETSGAMRRSTGALGALRQSTSEWHSPARQRRTTDEPPRRRVVVCGDNPLAHRLVEELTGRYAADVTVVLPNKRRNHGPRIAAISGVHIVESETLDLPALQAAGVANADALAILHQDDVGNVHIALRAQDLNPQLRLVIRMFNMSLGHGIRRMFHDCAVLSDASMAAPTFAAAALGEVAPTHIRLPGRTLVVAHRRAVRPQKIVCGLAESGANGTGPVLLPDDQDRADIVLAIADGDPKPIDDQGNPLSQVEPATARRRFARRLLDRLSRSPFVAAAIFQTVVSRRLWRAVLALIVVLIAGSAALAAGGRQSWFQAGYIILLNALGGGGDADLNDPAVLKAVQLLVTIAGVALVPVITAAVVEMMFNTPWETLTALGYSRHVVVVGLGNVGTRVMQQLHDLGGSVVVIDKTADARGVQAARQLGIPLIIGDAGRRETLRAANVQSARAVVALSTDDVINLEAALHARAINPDIRVVLRLFDGDFAELVQKSFGVMASRSVSYVAAPAFAAAIMEREVIGTIPVERRVLLVAEVAIGAGSKLDGGTIADARAANEVRVVAVMPRSEPGQRRPDLIWTPSGAHSLHAGDQLHVIATRGGLSQILGHTTIPAGDRAGSVRA